MKILVGAFSRSSLGHLVRACRVAAFLQQQRGHEVLFLCADETAGLAREFGLTVRAVPELPPQPPWQSVKTEDDLRRLTKTRMASPAYLADCLASDQPIVEAFEPDVMVSDLRHSLCVLGARLGVPVVGLTNLKLLAFMLPVVFPCVIESLIEIGVEPRYARRVFGDVIAIPGLSSYEPLSELSAEMWSALRESVREIRYLGPIAPHGETERSHGSTVAPGIYFSLGGSNSAVADLLTILRAVRHRSEKFVIHSGEHLAPSDIHGVLSGKAATVFAYANDSFASMSRAAAAVVHGGHGTVYECMLAGVPTLVVPRNAEQRSNARILEQRGMALVIDPEALDTSVEPALDRLLREPLYLERAREVQKRIGVARGLEEAARLIESGVC